MRERRRRRSEADPCRRHRGVRAGPAEKARRVPPVEPDRHVERRRPVEAERHADTRPGPGALGVLRECRGAHLDAPPVEDHAASDRSEAARLATRVCGSERKPDVGVDEMRGREPALEVEKRHRVREAEERTRVVEGDPSGRRRRDREPARPLAGEEEEAALARKQQEPRAAVGRDPHEPREGRARELEPARCRLRRGRLARRAAHLAGARGQQRQRRATRTDEAPPPRSGPAERDAELELHGVHRRRHRGDGGDEGPAVADVARREELEQVLAGARRVAGADGRGDAVTAACADERAHGGCREARRHRRVGPDREQRGGPRAAEADVHGRLADVPAVHREQRRATVATERGGQHVGQPLEEPGRAVVRGAHAVQVDVVSIRRRVDDRARVHLARELGGERRRMEVVHLERRRAPRKPCAVAAAAVRRDEHERRRAGRQHERRRRRHGAF